MGGRGKAGGAEPGGGLKCAQMRNGGGGIEAERQNRGIGREDGEVGG